MRDYRPRKQTACSTAHARCMPASYQGALVADAGLALAAVVISPDGGRERQESSSRRLSLELQIRPDNPPPPKRIRQHLWTKRPTSNQMACPHRI